ncbi:MAG: hypothetical protein ACJAVR_000161 [Paracoccaceae bacterium]|jgi:hypothetical protein
MLIHILNCIALWRVDMLRGADLGFSETAFRTSPGSTAKPPVPPRWRIDGRARAV